MNFKLRISIGIIFSLTLHLFLIAGILRSFPNFANNGDWEFGNWGPLFNTSFFTSNVHYLEKNKFSKKITIEKIIFPDIVFFNENIGIKRIKKIVTPQMSLNSILDQVDKFPENIDFVNSSKKKLSNEVGELLTSIIPIKSIDGTSKKTRINLNIQELKQFRSSLEEFLSKRWEVPIHLRGTNFSAFVEFEIKKNGRLLSWNINESSNVLLEKTLRDLLKNLQFLPSLPESYPEDFYKFGIKFSPMNLK